MINVFHSSLRSILCSVPRAVLIALAFSLVLGTGLSRELGFGRRKVGGTWLGLKPRSLPANSGRLRLGGRGACCGKQDGVGR